MQVAAPMLTVLEGRYHVKEGPDAGRLPGCSEAERLLPAAFGEQGAVTLAPLALSLHPGLHPPDRHYPLPCHGLPHVHR